MCGDNLAFVGHGQPVQQFEASRIVSQSDLLPITTPTKAGWPEVCSIFRDN
jgi:hypothetical protein